MPYKRGLLLIQQATENKVNEDLYKAWLTLLPHMQKSISFEEFKRNHSKKKIPKTNKTTEQLIAEAEKIKQSDLKRR